MSKSLAWIVHKSRKGIPLHPFLQILPCQTFLSAPFLAAHYATGLTRLTFQTGIGDGTYCKGIPLTPSVFTRRSLRSLRHGFDPFNASDKLGLQVRTSALTYFPVVVRKQVFSSKCSATVSVARAFGHARPKLRGPKAFRRCERQGRRSLNVSVNKRFYKRNCEQHLSNKVAFPAGRHNDYLWPTRPTKDSRIVPGVFIMPPGRPREETDIAS